MFDIELHWLSILYLGQEPYLHSLQTVAVIAEYPGQFDLPDLRQLVPGEGGRPAAVLVPEPVPELDVVEGPAHDTGEGGAHHGPRQRSLGDAGRPEVNISRTLIERPVSLEGDGEERVLWIVWPTLTLLLGMIPWSWSQSTCPSPHHSLHRP